MNVYAKIKSIMLEKENNVIVSIDVNKKKAIERIIKTVGSKVLGVKLHSDIVEDIDEEFYAKLAQWKEEMNFLVIEDRKFCDIGKTVKHQSRKICKYADLITVHSIPGIGILEGLRENCLKYNCGILLIAEMSSGDNMIDKKYTTKTVRMGRNNKDIVVGFIGQHKYDKELYTFSPGIRIGKKGDKMGQRYNTPKKMMLHRNVDVLIVGRGIMLAKNKTRAIDKYNGYPIKYNILREIMKTDIVQKGDFVLKSGQESPIYANLRRLLVYPKLRRKITIAIANKISNPRDTIIFGVPTGAIPLSSWIADVLGAPMGYVRDKPKIHGMKNLIEGVTVEEAQKHKVVVIEDVITTGGSVIEILDKLKEFDISVDQVLCILNRKDGGFENIKEKFPDIKVESLFNWDDLLK